MSKISASGALIIKIILGSIIMSLAISYINFPDNDVPERFLLTEQFITADEKDFYNKLSVRRSEVFNKNECLGHYNLCENDLTKTSYFISEEEPCHNNWIGFWTGKYGINSKDNILFMPLIQDHIMKELSTIYNKNIYYYNLDKYVNDDVVTTTSLIAVIHLYGPFEVINFFHGRSNLNKNIKQDLEEFARYKITTFGSYDYGKTDASINLLLEQECCSNRD